MTGNLSLPESGGTSAVWPRAGLALELTMLATAAGAGLLTAGTLIFLKAGTQRLIDPSSAARAWLVCVGLAGLGAALWRRIPADTVTRHRRPVILLLAVAMGWTLLVLVRPFLRAGDGLTAQYFANSAWEGWPAASLVDTDVSTARIRERWNGRPPQQFSARWTGFLAIERPGLYRFATTSDDGSQLYIDDQLVVDNSGPHSSATRSAEIQLAPGAHRVRLEYVQFGGDFEMTWSWARAGGRDRRVPSWALSRRPAGYGTVLAARLVDAALAALAVAVAVAAAHYVRVGVKGESVRRALAPARASVAQSYRNTPALVFSVLIFVATLLMPWPGGTDGWILVRSVATTIRDLNRGTGRAVAGYRTFQANLNSPRTGENVALPASVREMIAMLSRHDVERYQLSDALAADAWVYQQVVASAWPRKLEKDATARFVLNAESVAAGCSLIDRQTEVSLVHCP